MSKPRGILSPAPQKSVPRPPRSPGEKRIAAFMKKIRPPKRKK